ncbi:MAG: amidohydrolase family protein [Bryobacterales bacterium]|nr:amidohydrolase family protein [Bryobacterales bacterium]
MRICCSLLLLGWSAIAAEPADALWTARYVVTMDGGRVIEDGAVAVRGERIVAVGPRTEVEARFRPRLRVRRPDAAILPGLINTHTHAAMSLLRGIADDRRLQDWLENYIFPTESRHVSPDFVLWGTRLACLEMLLSGTTTFADMYYFEEQVAEAVKGAGMRGVLGQTVIRFPVADAKTPADALARARRFLDRYRNDPLIVPAVAPHALYTNSAADLRAARALADEFDAPLLIHLSETAQENEDSRAAHGKSPVRVLESLGLLAGRTLAAHGVWLDDADIAVLARRNVGVAHCPSSNMKLASGVAPVPKLLAAGIAVGLGTDGPAGSNNDFNMFEEMDLAAKLQKVTRLDPEVLPAKVILEMATLGGARALGMDHGIGSLAQGKLADFIAVRLDAAHAVPLYDIHSQIVYALKGSDVNDVVIHGRWIVRDRRALTLDAAAILRQARQYADRIRQGLPRIPPFE